MAKMTGAAAQALLDAAHYAGIECAQACTPRPMRIVGQAEPIVGGMCGFATINIMGNTALGRRISSEIITEGDIHGFSQHNEWNGFSKNYGSRGFGRFVVFYGQSYELKRAYAQGYSAYLTRLGHPASYTARID